MITYEILSKENFDILGEVIKKSNNCFLKLDAISQDILTILYNDDLFINFFMQLEQKKIKILEKVKVLSLQI